VKKNVWDIVLTTSNTFFSDLTVSAPLSISENDTVIMQANLLADSTDLMESMLCWDYEHAAYAAIDKYLNSTDWSFIFSHSITVEN